MKFSEFLKLMQPGDRIAVEFFRGIEDQECCIDRSMRADIVDCVLDGDGILHLFFDLGPYEAHNKPFEQANYYDKNGEPCLTARQAKMFNERECVYFSLDDDVSRYFRVISEDEGTLYGEYKKDPTAKDLAYTQWLESQVLSTRQALSSALEHQR